jgi:hypothetical protein
MDRPTRGRAEEEATIEIWRESVSSCPWYAELPQEGTCVAARAFVAAPAMHMTTDGNVSTRSLINGHKDGRLRVPGGSAG